MRTHAASSTPCALLRSPPPGSGAAERSNAPCIPYVDRVVIRDYFHQHDLDRRLRPAWLNALFPARHEQLLPHELECRLGAPFPGHERILVGGDVLLVETATRQVVDVMRNALPNYSKA